MKKSILNLKGVVVLCKNAQKVINGGERYDPETGQCWYGFVLRPCNLK
jgi:hypothetical protein